LLQPLIIGTLLVSVFALIFIAYYQYQEQQWWHSKYKTELQQDYKQIDLPVTIQLVRYGNVTDISKTEFLDSQRQSVKPMLIEIRSQYDYVTFWFDGNHLPKTLLLHPPNWGKDNDRLITVPFFDWQLSPLEPLVIPSDLCPKGAYIYDIDSYGYT